MTHTHISPKVMAELVDGASRRDRDALLQHLASCHPCAALYAELIGHRANFIGQPEMTAPTDWVRLGLLVPAGVADRERAPAPVSRRRGRRLALPRLAVAGLLAAVIAAAVWLRPQRQPTHPAFVAEIATTTERQMAAEPFDVAYSDQVEAGGATVRGGESETTELSESLPRLADYYNDEAMTAEVAYWLIGGYIATGQMRNAEVYLHEALALFPGDARIHQVAGILAYKQSDLVGAEQNFRAALDADPQNGVACFNLGVVLMEQRQFDAARPVIARAKGLLRGTPLADRLPSVPQ